MEKKEEDPPLSGDGSPAAPLDAGALDSVGSGGSLGGGGVSGPSPVKRASSSMAQRQKSFEQLADVSVFSARSSFSLTEARLRNRARAFWLQAKRFALQQLRRPWAQNAKEWYRASKDFVLRLPLPAAIVLGCLVGLCKILLLLLLFRTGCKSRSVGSPPFHAAGALGGQHIGADVAEKALPDVSKYESVAIMLTGEPRLLPFTGSSLVRHVIEPFRGAHVFVSAWLDEHAHRLSMLEEESERSKQGWELVSVRLWATPAVEKKVWESMPAGFRGTSETIAMVGRWFLVEDAFNLMMENEKKFSMKYSWVVQASLDQFWAGPVPPEAFDLEHEVAVPFTSTQGGLNEFAAVSQRRAAGRFMPRLQGLVRAESHGAGAAPSGVLFRLGLAVNMLQHIGFVTLPFCRLMSGAPGAILAVGSVGAIDGFPCHPCKDVVHGQAGWALATKGVPEEYTGPVPVITPNQFSKLGVCWGRLPGLGPKLYQEWNSGLSSGKFLGEADVAKVLEGAKGPLEEEASAAGAELSEGALRWQESPPGFSQCKNRMTKLQARGALADLDVGGPPPEVICKRWLMGPVEGVGINGWPVFRHLLNKDSVVYQLGVGRDLSFIKGMARTFGCNVQGFEAAANSVEWMKAQRLPMKFHHSPVMLGPTDGPLRYTEEKDKVNTFYAPGASSDATLEVKAKSLSTIMKMMNHDKVDLACLDMRGIDVAILETWANSTSSIGICQLLVRHYEFSPSTQFRDPLPLAKLLSLGFLMGSQIPVSRGTVTLFYHPATCLGAEKLN